MIPYKLRFHGHGGVRYVLKNGAASRSHLLTVKAVTSNRKTGRLAVIVSKKVHKGAVGRNRMRRRMYELLRLELPNLTGIHDIAIIISSPELQHIPAPELRAALQSQLAELGLYK